MLSFLRNYSVKIVYGIIITFVVTTFLGVVFFNESFKASRDVQEEQFDRQNAIATLGELSITNQMYQLELRRLQDLIPKDVPFTSELSEQIQLRALSEAIQNRLLLAIGQKQKLKATRQEINASLSSVLDQFGVTNKSDLKLVIQKAGGSYELMLKQLKKDIISAKTRSALMGLVKINDTDVQFMNKSYQLKEIYFSNISTSNVEIDDEQLLNQVTQVRDLISDSKTFDAEFFKKNPSFPKSASTERTFFINQTIPELARAIYSLNEGEISQPIKTLAGYHIVELVKKSDRPITQNITEDQLKEDWGNAILFTYLSKEQGLRELKIQNPMLRAVKLKNEGRIDDAIQAYMGAVSQDASSPYPNLFIAQLYLLKGDVANAKQSLLKAEIKSGLLSDTVLVPQIHILLARIYDNEKFPSKRNAQYDKLINENSDLSVLNYLKKELANKKQAKRLAKVDQLIKEKSVTESIKIEENIKLSNEEKSSIEPSLEFN